MHKRIIGNPTTTPVAIPDWNQTDETKANFIKNKPKLSKVAQSGLFKDLNYIPMSFTNLGDFDNIGDISGALDTCFGVGIHKFRYNIDVKSGECLVFVTRGGFVGESDYRQIVIGSDLTHPKTRISTYDWDDTKQVWGEWSDYLSSGGITDEEKAAIAEALNGKVDKEEGKGLSTNDFTDQYKNQIEENTLNVGRVSDIVDENNYRIGNLDNLNTDTTDNLVDAINEIYDGIYQTPIIEIPTTLEPNKAYNFGFVDNLSLSFPTYANDGDVIYITFFAESDEGTLPNLVIDTTNTTDIELIPENSTGYEIFAKYNGNASKFGIDNYWIVNYSEFTL
jgi:hypothetical protein